MKVKSIIFSGLLFSSVVLCTLKSSSQTANVQTAIRSDVSIPLREMKQPKKHFWDKWKHENDMEVPNKFKTLPDGFTPDGALQTIYNNGSKSAATVPLVNFNGTTNASNAGRVTPPDPAGDVGPNHYVQVVNGELQIFSKTGTSLYGPVMTSTLWSGFSGNWDGHNNGDAIVLYDENADRWIITQFAIDCPGTPYTEYEMVAVSTTGDPTGSYYRYAFQFDYMPDYPKLGVWQDGYYMSVNRFNTNSGGNFVGVGACVLERSKMLTGDASAKMVYFKTETLGGSGSAAGGNCWAMMPSDCDGTMPAAGTPNYFAYIDGNNTAELRLWALHADWVTTTNSTFTYVTALPVAAYTGMGSGSVPEQQTLSLDALGDRLMFRNQYRNFGSYETFLTCHSVNSGSGVAGIRWYEYRKTGSTFAIYQQSTFAPGDGKSRWMGSIAMNAVGDIGLAYSVSSSTMYPSIWFTGRKAADPLNQMTIAEGVIQTGTVSMTTYSRWGDYSALNVDPSDNTTFWTTQEYVGTFGGWCPWATKIASFKFANNPLVTTVAATGVTGTAATLNGTINPNGLATTYYFDWGTTTSYGNSTTAASAGSGSVNVNVSANLTGLVAGTTYHFRVVASNSDGVSNGNDLTFIPGAAVLTTTAASSVTMNSAATGGTITSDGGLPVTSRGVCWATTASPTISGSHTTDGSGTGTFTSSITGLLSNTLYHVRAYATNGGGTYYGNDLTFTTLCGNVTTFPWTEGFENAGVIPNCWTQEQVNSSGINWVFITGSGNNNPVAAHGGTYDACLKDVTTADNKTRLITPSLNLTNVASPQLKFWHTQAVWTSRQDQLEVYYRTSLAGTWTLLASYTTSITAWTQVTLSLPAGSSDYYIAFQGNAKYGRGICIDDVEVSSSCASTVPVTISIAASANPVCSGTSVTYTATPTNGGTTPVYQWKVNGNSISGATTATYAYTPASSDLVTCVLTSNATCVTGNPATSNTLSMTVNPLLSAVIAVTASTNPVCEGTSVTFTAIPINGGTTPGYQWKVNGNSISGATTAMYAYTPANSDLVTCVLTSNATCITGNPATSNSLNMTVNPLLSAGIAISASANPVCEGTTVTFTATSTNGGTTPGYQWQVNGNTISGATAATYAYTPANSDLVTCVLTSSATCVTGNPATSNSLNMTVNPLLSADIAISASANPVCEGTLVTFTATSTNGGTIPAYQWQVSGNTISGAAAATYAYTPANGDLVTCVLTSNATCVTGNPAISNSLGMTVNPLLPAGIAISASANPVCEGVSVTFTATPSNGGTTPGYQWQVNGTERAGATNATYAYVPANSDLLTCVLTSNATCITGNPATSNSLNMTVNPLLPVSVSIVASANPVDHGPPVTFTSAAVNAGASPDYQWKVNALNAGLNDPTYTYVPANGDNVSCTLTSSETCSSSNPANSNSIIMVVNAVSSTVSLQGNTVSGTECFNALQTIMVAGNETTFTVQPGGSATMIAGQNILYYPGTLVEPGGYMNGYIAPDGPWCIAPTIVTVITGKEDIPALPESSFFKIYPNPTNELFYLEFAGLDQSEKTEVEIYGIRGEKLSAVELSGKRIFEFTLAGRPAGIYLVHILSGKNSAMARIVKND